MSRLVQGVYNTAYGTGSTLASPHGIRDETMALAAAEREREEVALATVFLSGVLKALSGPVQETPPNHRAWAVKTYSEARQGPTWMTRGEALDEVFLEGYEAGKLMNEARTGLPITVTTAQRFPRSTT